MLNSLFVSGLSNKRNPEFEISRVASAEERIQFVSETVVSTNFVYVFIEQFVL